MLSISPQQASGSARLRVSSGSLPGLFRVSSGSLPGLFRVSSGSLPGLFRVSSESLPRVSYDSRKSLPSLFRESGAEAPRLRRPAAQNDIALARALFSHRERKCQQTHAIKAAIKLYAEGDQGHPILYRP
jgi:hypothetical protein